MRRVFISYARTPAEQKVARWLAARLRAAKGIEHVFLDEESLIPGSELRRMLVEGIQRADAVIFLISSSFVERDHPAHQAHRRRAVPEQRDRNAARGALTLRQTDPLG